MINSIGIHRIMINSNNAVSTLGIIRTICMEFRYYQTFYRIVRSLKLFETDYNTVFL